MRVKREGEEDREMHVNHLVLASGFSGEPRLPSFPRDEFKGYLTHSSGHGGCHGKDWAGKKAVVRPSLSFSAAQHWRNLD